MTSKIVPDGCAPIQQGACPAVAATRDVYYSYDLQDHQTAARFDAPAGSEGVANTFDGFGNLVSSTTAMGGISRTLGFAHDNDGNRIQVTHPDGVAFNMDYDGLDRATNQRWTVNGATTPFMAITYDAAGRRQDTHRGSSSTQYGYDGISRLASLNQSFAASAANVSQGFNYNPASQIISQTRDNDAYAYTGLANVDRPYQVNGLNQYSSAGSATFTYDANGNLITDGTGTYAYDAENRLVAVNGTSLTYDPLGRLWQIAGPSVSSVQFLYDGDKLALEYNGSGGILTRYAWGPEVDEPILADSGGQLSCSGTKFLHADWQGSIIAAADCNGNRTSVNSYDEYGIPAATNSGRFQYTGQAWLKEIGLYYYKARIYSPTLGRFLQTDPIGYDDQINLYAYVGNDPVDGRDPSGTMRDADPQNVINCETGVGRCDVGKLFDKSSAASSHGVNLPAEEAAGGHTIGRHVGKSDAFLRARMSSERYCLPLNLLCGGLKRAGTFQSLNSATRLINATLSANAARVRQVAAGEVNNAFVTARFSSPTGREAYAASDRQAPIIQPTFGVGVLIQHDSSSSSGYRVLTGYPRNDE